MDRIMSVNVSLACTLLLLLFGCIQTDGQPVTGSITAQPQFPNVTDTVTLTCPYGYTIWTYVHSSLPAGSVANGNVLTLKNTSYRDGGWYTCKNPLTNDILGFELRFACPCCPKGVWSCNGEKGCKVLDSWHCSEKGFISVPLLKNDSHIRQLFLHSNNLTTLPVDAFHNVTALTKLSLFSNRLTTIPAGVFDDIIALRELELSDNKLKSHDLPSDVFNKLTNLEKLDMASNKLTKLDPLLFHGLIKLKILSLSTNPLGVLPPTVFISLQMLEDLYLVDSKLTDLPAQLFQNNTHLKFLMLSHNKLARLPSEVFSSIEALTSVDLSFNLLSTIPPQLFDRQSRLEELDLSNNKLSTLPPGLFGKLHALKKLSLFNNLLTMLPTHPFDNLTALQKLELHKNPWACDENLCRWFDYSFVQKVTLPHAWNDTLCSSPKLMKGLKLDVLPCVGGVCSVPPRVNNSINIFNKSYFTEKKTFYHCGESESFSPTNFHDKTRVVLCLQENQLQSLNASCKQFHCNYAGIALSDKSSSLVMKFSEDVLVHCLPGYTFNPSKASDVSRSFACQANGQLSNKPTPCLDVNECTQNLHKCNNNGNCKNTIGSYTCQCKTGFTKNPPLCENVDECQAGHTCHANAKCIDTYGSYSCQCQSGYSGDGTSCSNVNECALDLHNCSATTNCTDTLGSYLCEKPCINGKYPDGSPCGTSKSKEKQDSIAPAVIGAMAGIIVFAAVAFLVVKHRRQIKPMFHKSGALLKSTMANTKGKYNIGPRSSSILSLEPRDELVDDCVPAAMELGRQFDAVIEAQDDAFDHLDMGFSKSGLNPDDNEYSTWNE